MSRYFKDMDPQAQESSKNTLARTNENFITIYLGCAERLIKILTLINSGGLITVLAYLYKSDSSFKSAIFSTSLVFFLIGLIFIFIIIILDFILTRKKLRAYRLDALKFNANKITFEEIRAFSPKKYQPNIFIDICGIVSITSAIIGIMLGLWGYFMPQAVNQSIAINSMKIDYFSYSNN